MDYAYTVLATIDKCPQTLNGCRSPGSMIVSTWSGYQLTMNTTATTLIASIRDDVRRTTSLNSRTRRAADRPSLITAAAR